MLTATLTDLSNALPPGTRALVRYLAQHKPRPGTPKEKNDSWEGIGRIFWGYLDPARFSKYTVPDADGFDGSKGHQRFIGLCPERAKATTYYIDKAATYTQFMHAYTMHIPCIPYRRSVRDRLARAFCRVAAARACSLTLITARCRARSAAPRCRAAAGLQPLPW